MSWEVYRVNMTAFTRHVCGPDENSDLDNDPDGDLPKCMGLTPRPGGSTDVGDSYLL